MASILFSIGCMKVVHVKLCTMPLSSAQPFRLINVCVCVCVCVRVWDSRCPLCLCDSLPPAAAEPLEGSHVEQRSTEHSHPAVSGDTPVTQHQHHIQITEITSRCYERNSTVIITSTVQRHYIPLFSFSDIWFEVIWVYEAVHMQDRILLCISYTTHVERESYIWARTHV